MPVDCIGPVMAALGLDESKSADTGRFLAALERVLADASVPECFLIHHMGHGAERSRGASRLRDWPDAEWRLVRQDDNPSSPRLLSAFGRDVDVPESRLDYDPGNRWLALAGGSRTDARIAAARTVPRGLIGQAQQVTGAGLWAATVTGKAQIAASGGTATHLAADPDLVAAEESRVDEDGRPLWPDGLATFAGVQVVPTAGATEPLLYDAQRVLLVVRSDYEALLSEDHGPAFERYAVALRLTARMAAAAPAPVMSMRRLEISGDGTRQVTEPVRARPAASKS